MAAAGALDDKIESAGSDLTVFCPAIDAEHIQWTALLYFQQTYGAEIYAAIIQPSPLFGCRVMSTPDNQFHLVIIGRGADVGPAALADSVSAVLFGGGFPDIAICQAGSPDDSLFQISFLSLLQEASRVDSSMGPVLDRIYIGSADVAGAAAILNDKELFERYSDRIDQLSRTFGSDGPQTYRPEYFRGYNCLGLVSPTGGVGFQTGIMPLRLPELISRRLAESPEKTNIVDGFRAFQTNLENARSPEATRIEKLKALVAAYDEITRLADRAVSQTGIFSESWAAHRVRLLKDKTYRAVAEAVGVEWQSRFEITETPAGRIGKLNLDLTNTGPADAELTHFRFHPQSGDPVIIDSLSQRVQPHQRLIREYPVDLDVLYLGEESGDSLLFSVGVVVEGLALDLHVPYRKYAAADISLKFLPGYTFLPPFTEDQLTALAQPFDWQLLITKPYASELNGRVSIQNPDGIVVGSFDGNIFMPEGITAKYMDIHLAAGRSLGSERRTVRAVLNVGGTTVAQTSADVKIIRCQIPATRDIAFLPDPDGRLEDFLRVTRAAFQPFSLQSLIRAPLEAYDIIIIGTDCRDFYSVLGSVNDRLREYVRNGGEVVILGQSFGWPHDIFDFPIYASQQSPPAAMRVVSSGHPILKNPYPVNVSDLVGAVPKASTAYPAIVGSGTEIISAGELGSYLKVSRIGDGYVIYCGLPLLELATQLNVEAIHLLANVIDFGHDH